MGDYGINNSFEYVELCVDSATATSSGFNQFRNVTPTVYTPDLIKYSWPNYGFTSKKLVVAALKVLTAEIPFVWDVINTGNNTFVYKDELLVNHTITIPVGTYSAVELATLLQTKIQVFTPGYLVTFDSAKIGFKFVHPSSTSSSLTFGKEIGLILGFLPDTYGFGTDTVISNMIAQVTGPYFLYLNSRKIGSLVNCNASDGTLDSGANTMIAKIPVNVSYGSVVFYSDHTEKYLDFFIGAQFDNFDLFLTLGSDGYQLPLNMKGASWSVKLGLLIYRSATADLYDKPSGVTRRGGVTSIKN
jgi:hypothetical protein